MKGFQRLSNIGSNISLVIIDDTPYNFTGKERDVDTGYDYFGARYYDSRIGRWMSVDPLVEKYPGLSPYNYVANNPLLLIDKKGDSVSVITSGPATQNTPTNSTSNSLGGHTAINVDGNIYSFEGNGKWQEYQYDGYMANEKQVRTVTEQTVDVDQTKVQDFLDNSQNGTYNVETNSCVSNTIGALDAGGIPFNQPNGAVTPEQLSNTLQNSRYVTNSANTISLSSSSILGTIIYKSANSILGPSVIRPLIGATRLNTVPLLPRKP